MNLLFRVIFAAGCKSTHHKLALDALRHLRCADATKWCNVLLKHHAEYLEGSKAPDTTFKDFRNHVLHVRDGNWGGAPQAARKWYTRLVRELRAEDWLEAAYAAGVLSHYYTDPIQPFHTAQSEAESNIHRAAEWSITKSYGAIRSLIPEEGGWPDVEVPQRDDWLEAMVIAGAEFSNRYYETLIDQYDFAKGVKKPQAGWDDTSRRVLARLVAFASVGLARVLECGFAEAGVRPPPVSLTVEGWLASSKIPVHWITRKLQDRSEKKLVQAMYAELQATGRVEQHLPEDDRTVRELHRKEVLATQQPEPAFQISKESQAASRVTSAPPDSVATDSPLADARAPIAVRSPGVAAGTESSQAAPQAQPEEAAGELPFYLALDGDVVDAPSIGPKTARRLAKAGIRKVDDFLEADAAGLAGRLNVQWIDVETIRDWQDQARLVCQIPKLRGHDAQILVACGWRDAAAVRHSDPTEMWKVVEPFIATKAGQRILRSGRGPDLAEVQDWIRWARSVPEKRAA